MIIFGGFSFIFEKKKINKMIIFGGKSNTIFIIEKKKETYCLKILAYLGLQKSVFVMYNLVFVAFYSELQMRWALKDNSEMIFLISQ